MFTLKKMAIKKKETIRYESIKPETTSIRSIDFGTATQDRVGGITRIGKNVWSSGGRGSTATPSLSETEIAQLESQRQAAVQQGVLEQQEADRIRQEQIVMQQRAVVEEREARVQERAEILRRREEEGGTFVPGGDFREIAEKQIATEDYAQREYESTADQRRTQEQLYKLRYETDAAFRKEEDRKTKEKEDKRRGGLREQRIARFEGGGVTKEDFISRHDSGNISIPGTVAKTIISTSDVVLAKTGISRKLMNVPILNMPVDVRTAESIGGQMVLFTAFAPAMTTTAGVYKQVASQSRVVLGTGIKPGAKNTAMTQVVKGKTTVTLPSAYKGVLKGKINRGLTVAKSIRLAKAGKLSYSRGVVSAQHYKTGFNLAGRQIMKSSGKAITGRESTLTFATGKRFIQVSFGRSTVGGIKTPFLSVTKGQVIGKYTHFTGRVLTTKGSVNVLGSVMRTGAKAPPTIITSVKPSIARALVPVSKAGQATITPQIQLALPKFQGAIPTLQGTIGSQFVTKSSLGVAPLLATTPLLNVRGQSSQIQAPNITSIVSQTPLVIQDTPTIQKDIPTLAVNQSSGGGSRQITTPVVIQAPTQTISQIITPKVIPKQTQRYARITTMSSIPTPPTEPPPTASRLFFPGRAKPQTSLGSFVVKVRRGGIFRPVGRARTARKAISIGQSITGKTLATSFQIVPQQKGRLKGIGTPKGYKRKKGLIFIESKGLRLNTPGEIKAIQTARRIKL